MPRQGHVSARRHKPMRGGTSSDGHVSRRASAGTEAYTDTEEICLISQQPISNIPRARHVRIHRGQLRQFYDVCELYNFLYKSLAAREVAIHSGSTIPVILCPLRQPITQRDLDTIVRRARRADVCAEATAEFVTATRRGDRARDEEYNAYLRSLVTHQTWSDRSTDARAVSRPTSRSVSRSVSRPLTRAPVSSASDAFWAEQDRRSQQQHEAAYIRGVIAASRLPTGRERSHFVPVAVTPRIAVSRPASRTTNSGMGPRGPMAPIPSLADPFSRSTSTSRFRTNPVPRRQHPSRLSEYTTAEQRLLESLR